MSDVIQLVGVGKIKRNGMKFKYEGTFPSESKNDDKVGLINLDALANVLRQGNINLLQTKIKMPKDFYEMREDHSTIFPDIINWNQEVNLYLDRHFYSFAPDRQLWLRYETIADMCEEESP